MRKIIGLIITAILVIAIGWFAVTTLAPEETLAPALDLEQNYSITLSNATISLDYPATWALNAEFPDLGLTVATDETLASLTELEGDLIEGNVYLNIRYSNEALLDVGDTPASVLQALVADVENPDGIVSDIETRTINGRVLAFVTLDRDDADGMTLVIDSGDAYSIMTAGVADGELAQHQSTIEAIAGSIEYFLIDDAPEITPEATEASE
ncbi:MAG: hypothetical protein Phog2KO_38990 [Phototrophicaceae bacterium]